jgi:hypothetical protein
MALNVFRQAGEMWRAMGGAPRPAAAARASVRRADAPGGRDGRDGARLPSSKVSRRVISGLAAAVLCWLCAPELAFSQPANISLINLNSGQLCVLGNQASYGLTYSAGPPAGWSWTSGANPVVAQSAATNTAIPINPTGVATFESARLYLFIIPPGATYSCSNITMPLGSSQIAFGGSPPAIPYAIGEWSLDAAGLHIDQENVDNFELPLMIEVSGNPSGTNIVFAQIGGAVYSPHMSVQTAVTGYAGQPSPFLTWLTDFGGASAFTSLVQAAHAPQAAMIEGPTLYLEAAPLTDPLATYFDTELTSLFSSAALQVTGDAAAGGCTGQPYCDPEQAWKVSSTIMSCPIYVSGTTNSSSIQMTGTVSTGDSFVICNPVGSVVPFTSSMTGYPSWTTTSCPFTPASGSTETCYVQITAADYNTYQKYNGWYFGQPQGLLPCVTSNSTCASGAGITTTAQIYSSCPGGSTLTGACISFTVGSCSPNCPNPTPNQLWAFSQITPGTTSLPLNVFESSGQMVFGGDGAFSSWISSYITNQNLSGIAGSVARNINEALNRGIAKCNNVTMGSPPATCQNMTPSALTGFTPPSGCTLSAPTAPSCPSDAWWSNEANWYAAGGVQNYYAQYLHTSQLTGNSLNGSACTQYSVPSTPGVQNTAVNQCANMLLPPNFYLATPPTPGCSTTTGWSPSARLVPMGTVYGFGYDENPNYLAAQPAQVPPKFDPLPSCWGSITAFNMVIGRTEPLAAHDFNGDSKGDIVWRDTGGNVALWLMNGAAVSSAGGAAGVPSTWSIVGQRDFNGDGMADLLWRDGGGDNAIWFMNGTQVTSAASIGNVPTNWMVVGTGDFNGDGIGDILWEDGSGNLAVWLMNSNATVLSSAGIGAVSPTVWTVAGVSDFNGDGRADILWRDTSGDTSIWFMNGTSVASAAAVGNVAGTWSVIGTGDFNGDGIADIAWRDNGGNLAIWLMNGVSVLTAGGLGNLPTTWAMVQTGDYNGDGMSDLLWRDSGGNTAMWFMNGTAVASTGVVGNISTTWTVQSANAD